MSIATRPYLSGNARLLPIDTKDPTLVLYLPLWYPYWDMTGSTIYSYDKNRHTGTVTGAVYGSQGRTFAGGDDLIDCGAASSLTIGTSDFTISAWVTTSQTAAAGVFIGKGGGPQYRLQMWDTPRWQFLAGDSGGAKSVASNSAPTLNTWYHVVGVKTGLALTMYVNGVLQTATDNLVGDGDVTSANNLIIGRYSGGSTLWHYGNIGEAAIWTRALSQAAITNLYSATKWRY